MKFIAIKTEDGRIKGKLAFYCRMLHVSRQGFYNYLANKDRPWKYQDLADYYPITKSQDKVELEDGFKVLVVGPTGTYGSRGPNRNTHPIEAVVFANWKYGYGGVDCYFNQKDLSIVY